MIESRSIALQDINPDLYPDNEDKRHYFIRRDIQHPSAALRRLVEKTQPNVIPLGIITHARSLIWTHDIANHQGLSQAIGGSGFDYLARFQIYTQTLHRNQPIEPRKHLYIVSLQEEQGLLIDLAYLFKMSLVDPRCNLVLETKQRFLPYEDDEEDGTARVYTGTIDCFSPEDMKRRLGI